MAIIHHKNGERKASEVALRRSQESIEEIVDIEVNQQDATMHGGTPWFDLAEMLMLHEEATRLIHGTTNFDVTVLDRIRRPLQ